MKRFLSLVVLAVFVASFAIANDPVKPVKKMENFTLEDYNGVKHSLTDFKDSKAVVLMFIATQCPISNAYNARMAELYKDYKGKNIAFVGINSNKQESVEEIKDHAKKNGLDFTILKDWNNVQADKFEASFTPEIYVLNSSLELLYHGRIDNSRRMEEVKDKDLRRARAAAISMIPSSTGAAKALHLVIPELKGKLDGYAMRVPTPNVSVVDLTVTVGKSTSAEEVNAAFRRAAEGPMRSILEYTEEELVSADFRGNPHSSIVDSGYTRVVAGACVKVLAWYDNEWGYSCRCRDLIKLMAAKL